MPFKTITIKEEVYEELLKLKKKDESFSDMFKRFARREKPSLDEFLGAWKMPNREWSKIKKELKKERTKMDKDFERRLRRLKFR